MRKLQLKRESLNFDELASKMEVVSREEQKTCVGGESPYEFGVSLDLSNASIEQKKFFLTTVAAKFGLSLDFTVYDYGSSEKNGNCTSGNVSVNSSSNLWAKGNEYDFALLLLHEYHHKATPWDAGTAYSEYEAYGAMIDSDWWDYASQYYRTQIDESYNESKEEAGM